MLSLFKINFVQVQQKVHKRIIDPLIQQKVVNKALKRPVVAQWV